MIINLKVYEKGFIFLRTKTKKKKIGFWNNPRFFDEVEHFLDSVLLNETEFKTNIQECIKKYTLFHFSNPSWETIPTEVGINSKTGDYLNMRPAIREMIEKIEG